MKETSTPEYRQTDRQIDKKTDNSNDDSPYLAQLRRCRAGVIVVVLSHNVDLPGGVAVETLIGRVAPPQALD